MKPVSRAQIDAVGERLRFVTYGERWTAVSRERRVGERMREGLENDSNIFGKEWSDQRGQRIFRMMMTQPKPRHKITVGLDTHWRGISTGGSQKIRSTYPIPLRFRI